MVANFTPSHVDFVGADVSTAGTTSGSPTLTGDSNICNLISRHGSSMNIIVRECCFQEETGRQEEEHGQGKETSTYLPLLDNICTSFYVCKCIISHILCGRKKKKESSFLVASFLFGLCPGCLAAVGLLAQEGKVGEATTKFGQFALGAFEVAGTVAASTDAPAKAAGAVGEEILEVVEFATAAATKVMRRHDAARYRCG